MYDIAQLQFADIGVISEALHELGQKLPTMEAVAQKIVRYFYLQVNGAAGSQRALALVRLYKTHQYNQLPVDLQTFASGVLGREPHSPATRCLTLLASAGDEPAWNQRSASRDHQAIPLESPQVVGQMPMIAALFQQLGLDTGHFLEASSNLTLSSYKNIENVFFVPHAAQSRHIPAQDHFVARYQIKSVLGFGSLLADGELFALIMFSKIAIPRRVAALFKGMGLHISSSLMHFNQHTTFIPAAR